MATKQEKTSGASAKKETGKAVKSTTKGVMRDSIHPDFGVMKVVMTDGSSFEVRSTLSRKQQVLNLDVDRHNHPAWNKNSANNLHERASKVKEFNQKYDLEF